MANLRQRILGCLDSLPKVVTQARIYRTLYNNDPGLWQAAETLYLGILDGIEAMLNWMDESAFSMIHPLLMTPRISMTDPFKTQRKL